MVAYNPVFRGKWTIKKFNATVINDVWPEVLFFTAVAVSACLFFPVRTTVDLFSLPIIADLFLLECYFHSNDNSGDIRVNQDSAFARRVAPIAYCPGYSARSGDFVQDVNGL